MNDERESHVDDSFHEADSEASNDVSPSSDSANTSSDKSDHRRHPAPRRRGVATSMLAAGLFALDEVLGRKPKKDTVEVREASGEPGDIDEDGITVTIDESTVVHSPAPRRRAEQRRVEKRRRQGS